MVTTADNGRVPHNTGGEWVRSSGFELRRGLIVKTKSVNKIRARWIAQARSKNDVKSIRNMKIQG